MFNFFKGLLILPILLMGGCSQQYWDDQAVDEYREQISIYYKNLEQGKTAEAEKILSDAKLGLNRYREENPEYTRAVQRVYAEIHRIFSSFYLNQYFEASNPKVKAELLASSLEYTDLCLKEDAITGQTKYEKFYCTANKAYGMIGLKNYSEAQVILRELISGLLRTHSQDRDIYSLNNLIERFFEVISLGDEKNALKNSFSESRALVSEFKWATGYYHDELINERARLIKFSIDNNDQTILLEQSELLKKDLGDDFDKSTYKYFSKISHAILLGIEEKYDESLEVLKSWKDEGIYNRDDVEYYRLLLSTQLKSNRLDLETLKSKVEILIELKNKISGREISRPMKYITEYLPSLEGLEKIVEELERDQLEKYREYIALTIRENGFEGSKTLFSKNKAFTEMSYRFFRAFTTSYSFAVISDEEFADSRQDLVVFATVESDDGYRRNVSFKNSSGRQVRGQALEAITEKNIMFIEFDEKKFASLNL